MLSAAKFWKFGRLAILALVILMTLGLSISHAKDFVLTPTADATVRSDYPNINFGNNTYLSVQNPFALSYLKFDLSVIPASYRIIGGTLSVHCYSFSEYGTIRVDLQPVADTTWSETGITWNNRPASGDSITNILVQYGWNSWTIPRANLPATGLVSFVLRAPFGDTNTVSFYSKEYGSYPPQLSVTAVKKMAPAAINLLLLGN